MHARWVERVRRGGVRRLHLLHGRAPSRTLFLPRTRRGREDAGLPEWLLKANPNACVTIPMKNPGVRSLNLATSVGIVMYHMLSLHNFGLPS